MIPINATPRQATETATKRETKTHKINFATLKIQGYIDDLEAIKQAIYMILNTEKGAYNIYPLSYGVNLEQFVGAETLFVKSEIENEIKEGLLKDERILNVYDFTYTETKETLIINFKVSTVYGNLSQEVIL